MSLGLRPPNVKDKEAGLVGAWPKVSPEPKALLENGVEEAGAPKGLGEEPNGVSSPNAGLGGAEAAFAMLKGDLI